jgi:hypothetical protein
MGLDNFPISYPCLKAETAVMSPKRDHDGNVVMDMDGKNPVTAIDCGATQEAGGCPWKNANPPKEGRVYGMLGCDCWYRGKYGNHILNTLGQQDVSFFGDNDDNTVKSPESCQDAANTIAEILPTVTDEDTRKGLTYAEWYLRWAADQTEGLYCWY